MAIGFRSALGSNNGGGGTTIVMTVPSGVVDGDIMLMNVTVRGGTGTTITDPAGWTLLGAQVNSTTVLAQKIYWRVANNEPASYTVTITSNKASGTIIALTGADSTAPVAAQFGGQANASSTTFDAPALGTWASKNGMRVAFGGIALGTTTNTVISGFTKGAEGASTGGAASTRTTSAVQYKTDGPVTTEAAISSANFWTAAAVQTDHQLFIFAAVTNHVLAGTTNGVSTGVGGLAKKSILAGSAVSASSGTGSLGKINPVGGTTAGVSSGTGLLRIIKVLQGSTFGQSSSIGALTKTGGLIGTTNGLSSGVGPLRLARSLTGQAAGLSSGTGDLTVIHGGSGTTWALSGSTFGTSSCVGGLLIMQSRSLVAKQITPLCVPRLGVGLINF